MSPRHFGNSGPFNWTYKNCKKKLKHNYIFSIVVYVYITIYVLSVSICLPVRPSVCLFDLFSVYSVFVNFFHSPGHFLCVDCLLFRSFDPTIYICVCVCWLAFVQLSIKPIVLKHKNFCSHIRQKRYSCVVNFLNRSLMWICDSETAEEHDDDADDVDLPLVRMAFHYPGIF